MARFTTAKDLRAIANDAQSTCNKLASLRRDIRDYMARRR